MMKSFRHIQIPTHSPYFADYGDKQYYMMPLDPTIELGDAIVFSEHDHAGIYLNVFSGEVSHIDVSHDGKKMLIVLEAQNEAHDLLEKIRNMERREVRSRKERFLKEKRQARYA